MRLSRFGQWERSYDVVALERDGYRCRDVWQGRGARSGSSGLPSNEVVPTTSTIFRPYAANDTYPQDTQ